MADSAPAASETSSAAIPITIVTGFLGSGKTTLILNLIPQLKAANPDYKIALVKNEFGDLAVDSQLAASSAVTGVQELLNGCICCNLVGQLGPALEELTASIRPDRFIIETSGSAFPATLALEVNRLARETGRYVLDGVISIIDVENWKGYDDTSYTAKVQARYTDLVVFNKWELCDEDRLDECRDRLGDLEIDVAWCKSNKGWVAMGLVFGVDGGLAQTLDGDEHAKNTLSDKHKHTHDPEDHDHSKCNDTPQTHAHNHQTEVEVLSVELKRGSTSSTVNTAQLMRLLEAAPKEEVYRIKAVASLDAAPRNSEPVQTGLAPGRHILNWAFGRWTFTPVVASTEHESSENSVLRMTVILARYEANQWKKKLESSGFLELAGEEKGELVVSRIL
ncbi:putative GTP-binding protein YjiA [Ceratocystis fimbriata CBS 114723]|uniref:Putative GTP-binding protein YjiA n=1 Tax=Ceratocystis fimbriata CBS 114723 TaxID=1035309 RepID=A0A2C5X5H8_9PEZI|nr:putative GTP-binding protein YjiA [Ceratocystis fimbriata CBS 114723]